MNTPKRPDPATQAAAVPVSAGTAERDIAHKRRRIVKGALAGAPIVMTLASRSALANVCVSPSRVFSGNASPRNDDFVCGGRSPGYWKQPKFMGLWPVTAPDVEVYKHGRWENDTSGASSLGKFFHTPPAKNGDSRIGGGGVLAAPQFGVCFADVFGPDGGMRPVVPDPSPGTEKCVVNSARKVCMWEILAFPTEVSQSGGMDMLTVQLARHLIAAYFNTFVVTGYPVTRAQIVEMWRSTGAGGTWCPIEGCRAGWGPSEIICYLKRTFDFVAFGPDDFTGVSCP